MEILIGLNLGVPYGSTFLMGCRQKFLSGMNEFILLSYISLKFRTGRVIYCSFDYEFALRIGRVDFEMLSFCRDGEDCLAIL